MYGIQFPTDPMMDHFLSSVISMVAPTWCHGPIGGNPFGRLLTEWTSESTVFNLVIRLRKGKQSAFFSTFHVACRRVEQRAAVPGLTSFVELQPLSDMRNLLLFQLCSSDRSTSQQHDQVSGHAFRCGTTFFWFSR